MISFGATVREAHFFVQWTGDGEHEGVRKADSILEAGLIRELDLVGSTGGQFEDAP